MAPVPLMMPFYAFLFLQSRDFSTSICSFIDCLLFSPLFFPSVLFTPCSHDFLSLPLPLNPFFLHILFCTLSLIHSLCMNKSHSSFILISVHFSLFHSIFTWQPFILDLMVLLHIFLKYTSHTVFVFYVSADIPNAHNIQ